MFLLYFAAIWGWGCLVCRRLFPSDERWTEFIAARVITGCSILYAVFIFLAWLHLLRPAPILIVLAVGMLLAIVHIRRFRIELQERGLFIVVSALALLQLACAFTPLIFYDSQVYQLLAPVEFLRAGYLTHIPWNVLANGPQAIQLTLGMSWALDDTGNAFKLLMALLGCLSLLAAARIGSEISPRAAMVSALFVAAYPEFWIHQTFGVVDLAVAAFLVFGTIWWMDALGQADWNRAILAGIAFGFVIGSRYQGVVLVTWFMAAIFFATCAGNPKRIAGGLKKGAVVAGIALLMTLPWLLRNTMTFGNPVYPLMYGVFGGPEWSAEQGIMLQNKVMGPALMTLPLRQMLLSPVSILFRLPSNGLFAVPMLLAGIAVAFFKPWKDLRPYAVLGLGGLFLWGLIHPIPGVELFRFNSASLILLLACAGAVLGGRGIYLAVPLVAGSMLIAIVSLSNVVPVAFALSSADARTQLWKANVPSWQVFDFANKKLDPTRHKVLLIGETRAVWLKVPFLAPSALNGPQLVELFSPQAGPDVWVEHLHKLSITHILICSSEWQRLADSAGYFRLPDDHLNRFLTWVHTLPVMFDDGHGNVLLVVG
ncbi:MAG TPA: hypothetical protein VKY31_07275 [Terriglobia bacterium]|nr:hypothetical protein [Terriglobia bacterium]